MIENVLSELKSMETEYRKKIANESLYGKEKHEFNQGVLYALDHAIILIKRER